MSAGSIPFDRLQCEALTVEGLRCEMAPIYRRDDAMVCHSHARVGILTTAGTRPMHANAPAPGPANPSFSLFRIELAVPPGGSEGILEELVLVMEDQAEAFRLAVEPLIAHPVVNMWDPFHPTDDEPECLCSGPDGWHCSGEWAEHWAKFADDPRSECGFCGASPEEGS